MALHRDLFLPLAVLGPVLLIALRRFASSCLNVVIGECACVLVGRMIDCGRGQAPISRPAMLERDQFAKAVLQSKKHRLGCLPTRPFRYHFDAVAGDGSDTKVRRTRR